MASKQEYSNPPGNVGNVKGSSSKEIFWFMTKDRKILLEGESDSSSEDSDSSWESDPGLHYPRDVDDWERNRALLLCYPEWRPRMSSMASLGKGWKSLVETWSTIERLYDEDYLRYGNKAYGKGECDRYIRSLVNFHLEK